jgi:glycosyltransferase involved in cell wall biosynthesis
MSLSLALPVYNSSEFFLEAIKIPLANEKVTEIVVSDDGSSNEEFEKLNKLIADTNSNKIKVVRNEKNLGAYKNKYNVIQNCTNKWVYLLDSDNYPLEGMLELFLKENLNENICYMPHKYDYCGHIAEFTLGFDILDKDKIKEAIKNNTIGHFVNLCNFFVSRDLFLKRMEEGFNIDVFPIADCATMTYLWLKHGGEFKLIQDYQYFHRVRDSGYYMSNRRAAENCVNHYNNKILQL